MVRRFEMSDEDRRMMEDWTKRTWDLPPYKSPEFMKWLKGKGMTLEEFRQLPIYQMAVAQGRIIHDEWVIQIKAEELAEFESNWVRPGTEKLFRRNREKPNNPE